MYVEIYRASVGLILMVAQLNAYMHVGQQQLPQHWEGSGLVCLVVPAQLSAPHPSVPQVLAHIISLLCVQK